MLHGDVVILQLLGLVFGFAQQLVQPAGDVNLVGRSRCGGYLGQALELLLDPLLETFQVEVGFLEKRSGQPAFLLQQRHQQMFDVHLLMAVTQCLGLGRADGFLSLLRKAVDVHCHPLVNRPRRRARPRTRPTGDES